jgi:hypothetical protein
MAGSITWACCWQCAAKELAASCASCLRQPAVGLSVQQGAQQSTHSGNGWLVSAAVVRLLH